MKKIFFICMVFQSINLFAGQFDTSKIVLNSKMLLTEFLNSSGMKSESYHKFVECDIGYKILDCRGFDPNVLFMKLFVGKHKEEANSCSTTFFSLYNDSVYIAYDQLSDKVYRINGFEGSDFVDFYYFLEKRSRWQRGDFNGQIFLKNFIIEDIDLVCFYNHYFKKKRCNKIKKIAPVFMGNLN